MSAPPSSSSFESTVRSVLELSDDLIVSSLPYLVAILQAAKGSAAAAGRDNTQDKVQQGKAAIMKRLVERVEKLCTASTASTTNEAQSASLNRKWTGLVLLNVCISHADHGMFKSRNAIWMNILQTAATRNDAMVTKDGEGQSSCDVFLYRALMCMKCLIFKSLNWPDTRRDIAVNCTSKFFALVISKLEAYVAQCALGFEASSAAKFSNLTSSSSSSSLASPSESSWPDGSSVYKYFDLLVSCLAFRPLVLSCRSYTTKLETALTPLLDCPDTDIQTRVAQVLALIVHASKKKADATLQQVSLQPWCLLLKRCVFSIQALLDAHIPSQYVPLSTLSAARSGGKAGPSSSSSSSSTSSFSEATGAGADDVTALSFALAIPTHSPALRLQTLSVRMQGLQTLLLALLRYFPRDFPSDAMTGDSAATGLVEVDVPLYDLLMLARRLAGFQVPTIYANKENAFNMASSSSSSSSSLFDGRLTMFTFKTLMPQLYHVSLDIIHAVVPLVQKRFLPYHDTLGTIIKTILTVTTPLDPTFSALSSSLPSLASSLSRSAATSTVSWAADLRTHAYDVANAVVVVLGAGVLRSLIEPLIPQLAEDVAAVVIQDAVDTHLAKSAGSLTFAASAQAMLSENKLSAAASKRQRKKVNKMKRIKILGLEGKGDDDGDEDEEDRKEDEDEGEGERGGSNSEGSNGIYHSGKIGSNSNTGSVSFLSNDPQASMTVAADIQRIAAAALLLVQAILESSAGPLLAESYRVDLDKALLSSALAVFSHCGEPVMDAGNTHRLALVRALQASILAPTGAGHHPLVPYAVRFFTWGAKMHDATVAAACTQALTVSASVLNPRACTVFAPYRVLGQYHKMMLQQQHALHAQQEQQLLLKDPVMQSTLALQAHPDLHFDRVNHVRATAETLRMRQQQEQEQQQQQQQQQQHLREEDTHGRLEQQWARTYEDTGADAETGANADAGGAAAGMQVKEPDSDALMMQTATTCAGETNGNEEDEEDDEDDGDEGGDEGKSGNVHAEEGLESVGNNNKTNSNSFNNNNNNISSSSSNNKNTSKKRRLDADAALADADAEISGNGMSHKLFKAERTQVQSQSLVQTQNQLGLATEDATSGTDGCGYDGNLVDADPDEMEEDGHGLWEL